MLDRAGVVGLAVGFGDRAAQPFVAASSQVRKTEGARLLIVFLSMIRHHYGFFICIKGVDAVLPDSIITAR